VRDRGSQEVKEIRKDQDHNIPFKGIPPVT
jgi:hypothetical protein